MKLIITIGISGSGKSTWAKEYIKNNPSFVRVNRDDLRVQVMGEIPSNYYGGGNKEMEDHITVLELQQIRYWLTHGKNVIVDNTHLQSRYYNKLITHFNAIATIEFRVFNECIENCKIRVNLRENRLDLSYIDKQFNDFQKIDLSNIHSIPQLVKPEYNLIPAMPALIFDLDGTLADCTGIRDPYDGENIHKDALIEPVASIVKTMRNTHTILYLSGREEKWREGTLKWVITNNLPNGRLLMRKTGDQRDDSIVKREIYMDQIHNQYDVRGVFDDRIKVCWMWYDLGLHVFNVNQNLKWF